MRFSSYLKLLRQAQGRVYVGRVRRTALAAGWLAMFPLPLLLMLLAGCSKSSTDQRDSSSPSTTSSARETAPAQRSEVALDDADLLRNVAIGSAATNTALLAGDQAWEALLKAMAPPAAPPEWETNRPTREAIIEFNRKNAPHALKVADLAREFYTKFPDHENAPRAREREEYLIRVAMQGGLTNAASRLSVIEEAKAKEAEKLLKDPNLSEEERLQLRVGQLQREVLNQTTNVEARLAGFEKGARSLMKEFPARPELGGLLESVAQLWIEHGSAEKARPILKELAEGDYPEQLKGEAASSLKKVDRLGKPLVLQFKAVDGRKVDLQAMKGKVVLIDFWATWCGPCMAELPNVKAAYTKLKPKGFEIVGISYDQDKAALTNVVAMEGMSWPHYFEEDAEVNRFAKEFEVGGIPTMWLVDKKGNLRNLNAREDLEGDVQKLLAE